MWTRKKVFQTKYFCLFIFLCSCSQNNDCFTSTGILISETRTVQGFDIVYIYDNINLIFNDSVEKKVYLQAGKNIINNISTETKDGSLIIKNRNKCNWLRSYNAPVTVEINLPKKCKIFIYGSGAISSKKQLNMEAMNIHHYGASDIDIQLSSPYIYITSDYVGNLKIKGQSALVECNTFKFGRVNLSELKTKKMIFFNNAEADSYISCDSIITGSITGKGSIIFTGNAKVSVLEKGTGRIVKE